MNDRQVFAAIELSRTGSFSVAAKNLYVSQSTLSYQIRELEREIGFALFDRSGKMVVPTLAGERFVRVLGASAERIARAVDEGRALAVDEHKIVSIGLARRSLLPVLPEAIRLYHELYPGVAVLPQFGDAASSDSFLSREIDLICSLEETLSPYVDVRAFELYRSRIFVVMSKENTLSTRRELSLCDLADQVLMSTGCTSGIRELEREHSRAGGTLMTVNGFDGAMMQLAMNAGVVLEPGFMDDGSDEFAWIPLSEVEALSCPVCARADESRPWVLAFANLLADVAREHPEALR